VGDLSVGDLSGVWRQVAEYYRQWPLQKCLAI